MKVFEDTTELGMKGGISRRDDFFFNPLGVSISYMLQRPRNSPHWGSSSAWRPRVTPQQARLQILHARHGFAIPGQDKRPRDYLDVPVCLKTPGSCTWATVQLTCQPFA